MTILVLSIAVPAALALASLVALNVVETRRAQEQALLATARAVSTAVDMELVRDIEALQALASSEAAAARDWDGVKKRAERLKLGAGVQVSVGDGRGAHVSGRLPADGYRLASPGTVRSGLSPPPPAISDLVRDPGSGRGVVTITASPPSVGENEAVVSLLLDPTRFLKAIQLQALPAEAMVTLVDRNRRVVARSRRHAHFLGALATPGMRAAMEIKPDGVVPSRSLDGERTVVAYARSSLSGWTAMVVVPRGRLETPVWTNIAGVSVIFAFLGGLSLLAVRSQSHAISNEIEALEQDANAVGQGRIVTRRAGRISSFDQVQTALSDASAELDRREQRHKLLINELNHRVKNTLATVQALAAHTFRGTEVEARCKFEERLAALGAAHDLLTQTAWTEIQMHDVLARCGGAQDERISSAGPLVRLPPEAALALCMCVHELTTNSLKYGALAQTQGRVVVEWTPAEEGGVSFTWRETGGPPVVAPAREGFGTKLVDRLVRTELKGRLERIYDPAGLIVRAQFQLSSDRRFRSEF